MKSQFRSVFLFICLIAFSLVVLSKPSYSQNPAETGERETLDKAATAPNDSGMYAGINQLPESVRRSAPFARALEEMKRKAGTSGTFDVEARVQAIEQAKLDLMESSRIAEKSDPGNVRPLDNAAWTSIGLVGSSSNGVFSAGCTTAIAIDPTNPNIMYAGGTSGGVWKSTDAGAHWTSLTDLVLPSQSVASISIDPKHHNTLYVGTGNGFAAIDELTGTGLYKSEDGGGTWTRIGTTGTTKITGTVIKVMVDPQSSNIVFASMYSSSQGLYRSSDSGTTWTKVHTAFGVVWDMVAGSVIGGTQLLYCVDGNNIQGASTSCGVYKSIDNGVTWSKINSSVFPRGDTIGRCAMAASVAHPERIFVLMANPGGDGINKNAVSATKSLFRSSDNGSSWSEIDIPNTLFAPAQAPQGWYDCVLGVTPNSSSTADTMFIAGIEAYVNYSDGNGWQDYNDNQTSWTFSHVDHHSIAFNPKTSSIVFDGGDGGLYMSSDGDAGDATSWSYRSNQMVTGRVYHLGLDKTDPKTTWSGMQDQGTWSITSGGSTVLEVGGDGIQPVINLSTSTEYAELPNGEIYKKLTQWTLIDPNGTIFTDNTDWDTPFKMSLLTINGIQANHILYVGRQHLWLSTNDGTAWSTISGTFDDNIHSIGLSQVDPKTIYLGTSGQISVTTNSGTTWTSVTSGLPGATVSSIVTNGHNQNFALASFQTTTGHRVMRTLDKGATWADVSGKTGSTLPAVGVNCVALDSVDALRIWYAATDIGIYYTMDSGSHWSIAGGGIGLADCRDVEIQSNKTTIRVATFGRGIWEGNTGTLPVELSSLSYSKQFDQNGQPQGTNLAWHTDSENGDAYFVVQRSIDGTEFQDLTQIPSKAAGGNSTTPLSYSYLNTKHDTGTYLYQLEQVDLDGSVHFSNSVELHWGTSGLIVSQNYPNPLLIGTPSTTVTSPLSGLLGGGDQSPAITPWPETRFHYELPTADVVTLKIYNSTGKLVRTILDQVAQSPGDPDAFWDGKADDGAIAPSGAYFYVIQTQNSGTVVNKMILLSN